MPMKNPVHPGALAKANLDELNLSVAEAAKAMRVTRQQLHNVLQGRSAVTPQMALRFEKAFGGSADMWLRMQAAYDLAQARKLQGEINIPRLVVQASV
jgi:addiction module HigA family antidote